MAIHVNCLTCNLDSKLEVRRIDACTAYELALPKGWLVSEDKLAGVPRSPLTFFVICPECAKRFPVPEPTVIVKDNHA
jgi:hypothetical protein